MQAFIKTFSRKTNFYWSCIYLEKINLVYFYSKIKEKHAVNCDNRINISQICIFTCGQSVVNNKYIETEILEIQIFFKLLIQCKNIPIGVCSLGIRGDKKLLNIILVKTELKWAAIECAP